MSSGQIFVLLLVTISTVGWVLRGRRGAGLRLGRGAQAYFDDGNRAVGDDAGTERAVALLTRENERLVGQIGRLEERIAVLERIVTDPAERVAREIEKLR